MDKGLTVPKWVLKIPQMLPKLCGVLRIYELTKMGADKAAENTPNAPKFICPNCLPKPKSLGFR